MAVCLCGMHRSGTSMVSHILSLCGVYMGPPEVLVHSAPSNRDGFWEDSAFVNINDELLDVLQGAWDVPPVFLEGWQTSPAIAGVRQRAGELIAQRADKGVWGWKDPRTSLTLPFWMECVPDLRIVVCLRNPQEVAQSLNQRDYLSVAFGLRLWYLYQARIIAATRPENRLVTHYDAYFADPQTEIRRVLDFLQLETTPAAFEQAGGTCTGRLRNNHATEAPSHRVPQAVIQLYEALCHEAGPVCAAALKLPPATSDAQTLIQGSFDAGRQGVAAGVEQIMSFEHVLRERVEAEIAARDQEIRRLGEYLAARHQEFGQLNAECALRDREVRRLTEELGARHQEIARLQSRVSEGDEHLQTLGAALATREERIAALAAQETAREATIARMCEELSTRQKQIETLTADGASQEAKLGGMREELSARDQRILDLVREAESTESTVRQLHEELTVRDEQLARLHRARHVQRGRIHALRQELAEARTNAQTLDERLQHIRTTLQELQSTLESRDSHLAQVAHELHEQQRRVQQLTLELHGRDTEIQRLQGTAAALHATVNGQQAQLAQIQQHRLWRLARSTARFGAAPYRLAKSLARRTAMTFVVPLLRYRHRAGTVTRLRERGLERAAQQTYACQFRRSTIVDQLLRAPWFNADWYRQQNPDVVETRADPLTHYLAHGAAEGRSPSLLFDTNWYLLQNPDVNPARIAPLLHYVLHGVVEGRKPNPLFDMEWLRRQHTWDGAASVHPLACLIRPGVHLEPNPYFDAAWYKAQYPDVAAAGVNPLAHYLNVGWTEGRNPGPLFDNDWYLRQYPDVPGMNPLAHYLSYGMLEGRAPHPAIHAAFAGPAPAGPVTFQPEQQPLLSLLVPPNPRWLHTLWLLHTLRANGENVPYEVLVIDDSHLHGTWGIRNLVRNATLIAASSADRAADLARGKYVLWLESDIVAQPGYLQHIVQLGDAGAASGQPRVAIHATHGIARLANGSESSTTGVLAQQESLAGRIAAA